MSVEAATRNPIDLCHTLFPNGVSPGNMIEIKGASRSGKTYLITYLLAKFVVSNPHNKAIFIDTTSHFNTSSFFNILSSLLHLSERDQTIQTTRSWNYSRLESYLNRIIIIRCFSSEDLLFCFGPKNAGRLETMLLLDSEVSVVFIDCLNGYSFCPSLNGVQPSNCPDIFELLKRSVDSTKTPVICTVSDIYRPLVAMDEQSKVKNNKEQFSVITPDTYDKRYFTHSLQLQRGRLRYQDPDPKGGQSQSSVFICRIYHFPKNSKMVFSRVNYSLKFSIISGILKWCDTPS